jgi:hypothetical protein
MMGPDVLNISDMVPQPPGVYDNMGPGVVPRSRWSFLLWTDQRVPRILWIGHSHHDFNCEKWNGTFVA